MRAISTLITIILLTSGIAFAGKTSFSEKRSLYDHLVGVNSEWSRYISESGKYSKVVSFTEEKDLLRVHFSTVIRELKKRKTEHLSDVQKKNRKTHLRILSKYARAGNFPVNYDYSCNKPCFIDEDGGICAVGQLLIESGKKEFAYFIASNTKYAFIREMNYPELNEWQEGSGFTMEEIALIQPSYGWSRKYEEQPKMELAASASLNFYPKTSSTISGGNLVNMVMDPSNAYKFDMIFRVTTELPLAISTGAGYSSGVFLRTVHGNFGAASQPGDISSVTKLEYLDIPLRMVIRSGKKTKYYGSLGLNCGILSQYSCVSAFSGSVSGNDMSALQLRSSSYRDLMWSFTGSFGWKFRGRNAEHMALLIEPNFSYGLTKNTFNKKEGMNVVTMGIKTGLVFNTELERTGYKGKVRKQEKRKKREEKKKQKQENRVKF